MSVPLNSALGTQWSEGTNQVAGIGVATGTTGGVAPQNFCGDYDNQAIRTMWGCGYKLQFFSSTDCATETGSVDMTTGGVLNTPPPTLQEVGCARGPAGRPNQEPTPPH